MHRLVLVLWSIYLDAWTFITPLLPLVLLLLTKIKCIVGHLAVPISHMSQLMLTDDKSEWKLGAYWSHGELLYGATVDWQLLMYHKTTRTENYAYEKWPSYQIKKLECSSCSVLASGWFHCRFFSHIAAPVRPRKRNPTFSPFVNQCVTAFFPFCQPTRSDDLILWRYVLTLTVSEKSKCAWFAPKWVN